jgi:hypothetical protein
MGIHLLCCVHGNECIGTHDAICSTFANITQNVGFHMGWKQLHVLLSTTFNSFCWWTNIVFTKYGIHTLADIVIVDLMRTYLLPRSCTTQRFATFNAAPAKERSYRNWHPINEFLPLAIKIFGCLHKHANVFLHNCANVIWSLKGPKALHLTLINFLHNFFWSHYKGYKHPPS